MLRLFRIRGFGPYLLIAFLNAFSDLGHKMVIQNAIFKHYSGTTLIILTAVVNALILLPMIALFSPTGFVADKYPKDRVIKRSALFAIPLFAIVAFSYSQGWFTVAYSMTMLLGAQAAFYAPARVSYIRELVGQEKIAQANSFLQATSIVGILAGTFVFSVLFEHLLPAGMTDIRQILPYMMPLGLLMIACTLIEFS